MKRYLYSAASRILLGSLALLTIELGSVAAQELLPLPQSDQVIQSEAGMPPRAVFQQAVPRQQNPNALTGNAITIAPQGAPCGCQTGQRCVGGCQPCMHAVDCSCGCGAELRWKDIKRMNFGDRPVWLDRNAAFEAATR